MTRRAAASRRGRGGPGLAASSPPAASPAERLRAILDEVSLLDQVGTQPFLCSRGCEQRAKNFERRFLFDSLDSEVAKNEPRPIRQPPFQRTQPLSVVQMPELGESSNLGTRLRGWMSPVPLASNRSCCACCATVRTFHARRGGGKWLVSLKP